MLARAPRILIFAAAIIFVFGHQAAAQDFRSVHEGVEYAEVTRDLNGKTVRVNLLRLDLTKVRIDVAHALDSAIGTEKTSSIAARHGAVAAINAGFFRLDRSRFAGDAAGILMIDGSLWSESVNDRATLLINNNKKRTDIRLGHVTAGVSIAVASYPAQKLAGVNRERKPNEAVLYTPVFGPTTMTDGAGTEIVLSDCRRVCKKVSVREKTGDSAIPRDGFVISIGSGEMLPRSLLEILKAEEKKRSAAVAISTKLFEKEQPIAKRTVAPEDITNGVPILIRDGKIDVTWQLEKSSKSFVETRHPRTAVAKLKDGKFLMITVDGRTEQSGGIGLEDLAAYLLELGATDAINLDGGGSTTMFLDGKVVNHPSDKEGERKVSDAILVTLRQNARRAK